MGGSWWTPRLNAAASALGVSRAAAERWVIAFHAGRRPQPDREPPWRWPRRDHVALSGVQHRGNEPARKQV